jgi:hypothetical protein
MRSDCSREQGGRGDPLAPWERDGERVLSTETRGNTEATERKTQSYTEDDI